MDKAGLFATPGTVWTTRRLCSEFHAIPRWRSFRTVAGRASIASRSWTADDGVSIDPVAAAREGA